MAELFSAQLKGKEETFAVHALSMSRLISNRIGNRVASSVECHRGSFNVFPTN